MAGFTPLASLGSGAGFGGSGFGGKGLDLPALGSGGGGAVAELTGPQKVAIIVRLLLSEGAELPLTRLPDHLQAEITQEIGRMRSVNRATLEAVVQEFVDRVESIGLSFPGGLDGALSLLDGHLSPATSSRLRRMAGASGNSDPWERIAGLEADRLLPVLEEESTEIGAVLLSKLAVSKAADLLGRLPGDKARRIAYAVSLTGNVDPGTVRRIGLSLASQLDAQPAKAFDTGPVERVGAILNYAAATTRDEVLTGLDEVDAGFAEQVRRAIFTFTNIPVRIDARDIPKVIRNVDQAVLVTALAGARDTDLAAAEFILANMSQRMAASLRDEMANLGKVKDKDAEAAMATVVTAIREMEAAGEIFLVAGDED
ncbi:flagellar motor switch protein FliG [Frigidibacter mobilis]|uniref:Flagellar motor switch protein FliG n=1 Tax=Frigidibacter mobilis TaxID=1335048 RepID=A0A159Z647_9RHOB|nr:FliG C-terminal domain-containing protein [Frigidibacter mobilis]AMY69894.1 flagellar motor switch protein FliG [Frigidibacter mobilis]